MIVPDKNQMERMIELNPGSVIFPSKYLSAKKIAIIIDKTEIAAPKPTNILRGLSEKETITLKAREINLEKL